MKMVESGVIVEHLNDNNTITIRLTSIGINFDDEARALLILSSLPKSWDSLVMALNNSSESGTLKFNDVVSVILSEEIHKKSLEELSGSALNVKNKRRARRWKIQIKGQVKISKIKDWLLKLWQERTYKEGLLGTKKEAWTQQQQRKWCYYKHCRWCF